MLVITIKIEFPNNTIAMERLSIALKMIKQQNTEVHPAQNNTLLKILEKKW
jgi:hypothetical protein